MEIFIVGAVVVALMVFVSTKIKRSAALAFEPEFVEKEDFTISKPEGFMSPLDGNSEHAFEAYSREFGEKMTRNVWQAHAILTVDSAFNFEAECERAKKSADRILSENFLENDSESGKIYLLESEKTEDEIRMINFRKIVENRARRKTYDLQISVLPAFRAVYIERINEMINSFRLR